MLTNFKFRFRIGKVIVKYAQIAQSVEQRTENPRVGGSIPPLGTIDKPVRLKEHPPCNGRAKHETICPES